MLGLLFTLPSLLLVSMDLVYWALLVFHEGSENT